MGREICRRALAAGGDVIAWDMDGAALAALVAQLSSSPGTLRTAVVDVTDRDRVAQAAAEVGPVDILVNNAGIVAGQRFVDEAPEVVERVMGVNALSLFWTTHAFLPAMIERDSGHLVTLASAAGLVPLRGAVSYTASKHAAVGFHDALRQELRVEAPHVRTTLVTPFFVNTGMYTARNHGSTSCSRSWRSTMRSPASWRRSPRIATGSSCRAARRRRMRFGCCRPGPPTSCSTSSASATRWTTSAGTASLPKM